MKKTAPIERIAALAIERGPVEPGIKLVDAKRPASRWFAAKFSRPLYPQKRT
jgi:hypothetical protein